MRAGFFRPRLLILLSVSALAGCAFPASSPERQEVVQGCRAAADRAYNAQNRYQLSERDNRDTPFSGSGQAASPSDGLADQYTHANRVEDCVRRDGLTADSAPAPAPAPTP